MDELEFENLLEGILIGGVDTEEIRELTSSARTFQSEGVLTRNKGIVVRMKDGSEFQLTIVRSK